MSTFHKINRAAVRRQTNWLNGCDPQASFDLTVELNDLWAQLRLERARNRHGERRDIIRRARVERELERLSE